MFNPKQFIGLDIETSTAKFPWRKGHYVSCISTYEPQGTRHTFWFVHDSVKVVTSHKHTLMDLQKLLNKYDGICAHNLKFDLEQLTFLGIDTSKHTLFCTMVAKYLIQYHFKLYLSLNDCARLEKLPIKDERVKSFWRAGKNTHEIPADILGPYCEHDAYLHYTLMTRYVPKLKRKGLMRVMNISMLFMRMLADMEANGIVFDVNKARRIVTRNRKLIGVLYSKINQIAAGVMHPEVMKDFNPASNDDLSVFLYGGKLKRKRKGPKVIEKNVKIRVPTVFVYKNGTKRIKTRIQDHPRTRCLRYVYKEVSFECQGLAISPLPKSTTAKSTVEFPFFRTDKDTLPRLRTSKRSQALSIALLMKISKLKKLIETFEGKTANAGLINKIADDGLLHTNYNQCNTFTGRLSSSDPNSQNLPRSGTSPVKSCILPRFDWILNADLSQIELRVPACLSQDAVMIHELNTGDLHDYTRKHVLKLSKSKLHRVYAKIFNFRMIYRGSAWGFFMDPKMKGAGFKLKQWEQTIRNFYAKYKQLDAWHWKIMRHVIDGDGTLQAPTGRWYKFKLFNGKYNEHQIVNYPVQGIAGGDILPLAAVLIYGSIRKRGLRTLPILTVHDSLVFDVPDEEVIIVKNIIETVFKNMPKYIQQYFGIKWNVNITGDIEKGRTYGDLQPI